MTTGTKITRCVGLLLGAFYLFGTITHNQTVSNLSERWEEKQFVFHALVALLCVSPLLVPSRVLLINRKIWVSFFLVLVVDCILFTWKVITDTFWAFRHGEWTQQIAFPSLGLFFWFILVTQVIAYMRLRGTTNAPTLRR
jgi:hypothetical protein